MAESAPSEVRPGEPAAAGAAFAEAEALLQQLAGLPLRWHHVAPPPAPAPPPAEPGHPAARADGAAGDGHAPPAHPLPADRFGALPEAVPDALVIVDQGGAIVLVNSQAEKLFGYRRDELLGRPVELLVPDRFRGGHVAHRAGYAASPRTRPMGAAQALYGRRKDGSDVPVEISLSPLATEDGLLTISTIRDVTERKKTELQLRKLEARYRTLVEGIPAVTFMAALDEGLNELYVSPQIEALLGFSQKEWLEDPVLWYTRLHPDDRPRWHHEFAVTCARGTPFRSVYRFLARDGRVVWVHGEAHVVRDRDGRPLFLQGVAFDITAMKQAEEDLKALNQVLEQRVAERTEELARSNTALEQFAWRVTHDLKEPLRTIKSFTQKLTRRIEGQLDPVSQRDFARVGSGADRMEVLIDDLLAYSRVGTRGRQPAPTACVSVLSAACANLHAAIEECGAEVTYDALPVVLADATQLGQLFQNLLANALKFRSPDGPPRIHVSARPHEGQWLLSVTDNGIGIEGQYLQKQEKLFGLGERLHGRSQYPGHGIGLATCEKIVQRHGGRIWAESPGPGQGSTFCFTLPPAP